MISLLTYVLLFNYGHVNVVHVSSDSSSTNNSGIYILVTALNLPVLT
jgi:hypothetical protein